MFWGRRHSRSHRPHHSRVSVSSGGSSLFWGRSGVVMPPRSSIRFSILWWIEFVLGSVLVALTVLLCAGFSILWWIEFVLGSSLSRHLSLRCISVSVSSGGSSLFWGWMQLFIFAERHKVSVSSGGSSLFWGLCLARLRASSNVLFQYPLVDRVCFGV